MQLSPAAIPPLLVWSPAGECGARTGRGWWHEDCNQTPTQHPAHNREGHSCVVFIFDFITEPHTKTFNIQQKQEIRSFVVTKNTFFSLHFSLLSQEYFVLTFPRHHVTEGSLITLTRHDQRLPEPQTPGPRLRGRGGGRGPGGGHRGQAGGRSLGQELLARLRVPAPLTNRTLWQISKYLSTYLPINLSPQVVSHVYIVCFVVNILLCSVAVVFPSTLFISRQWGMIAR